MKKYFNVLNKLKLGDRIVVPKSSIRWVQHHAIYLGFQNGEHWFIENKEMVGVRVVSAKEFFNDVIQVTRIERFKPKSNYGRQDLVRYALSLKGKSYKLFGYNCESFANQVQYGVVKSRQAETGIAIGIVAVVLGIIALPFMVKR